MKTLKLQILRYLAAMNATAVDAGVHTFLIFTGLAGAQQVIATVPAINLQQAGIVFLIAFGRSILDYIDKHPLTDLLPPKQ